MSTGTEIVNTPGTQIEVNRAEQEVMAAITSAKKFPRDEQAARQRILTACKRVALAEVAMYSYPRGGTQVTGPSIRLAEVLAQNWGNLHHGVIELEKDTNQTVCLAFCKDLETNNYHTVQFIIDHTKKAGGEYKKLVDPRDIYEHSANLSARRLRNCILKIIPPDVLNDAVLQCDKTLAGDQTVPIEDRIKEMLSGFAHYSVSQGMIEERIGHKIKATNEHEIIALKKIFISIKDGMVKREDYFKMPKTESQDINDLNERVAGLEAKKQADTTVTPIKKPAKARAKKGTQPTETKEELAKYMVTAGRLTGQTLGEIQKVVLEGTADHLRKAEERSPEMTELLRKIDAFLKF